VAAKANELDLEFVEIDVAPNAAFKNSAEYRSLNALGKIPTFVGANGFVLTEAIAIAIYSTFVSPLKIFPLSPFYSSTIPCSMMIYSVIPVIRFF
jgi:glutathione S-transferase